MKPSKKSFQIEEFLEIYSKEVFGCSRKESIVNNKCVMCKIPVIYFKDEKSRFEYSLSGFCQECQDKIFEREE